MSSGSTLHGSSRQYECIPDHVTTPDSDVTSMTITCQSTGAWTATNFQCVIGEYSLVLIFNARTQRWGQGVRTRSPGKSQSYEASIQWWAIIGPLAKRHLNGVPLVGQ